MAACGMMHITKEGNHPMRLTKRELMADGVLLLTALIWGSAFAIVKNSLDAFAPAMLITLRYVIATPLAALAFRKHLRGLTRADVLRGALVGVILGAAYIAQTVGLAYTTAGKNAFLTAVYVLIVPFISLLCFMQKLRSANFIAAGLMVLGIGALSLDGEGGGLNAGDVLTLLCSVLFAAHIVAVERCQKKTDAYALIVLQFAFCAVTSLAYSLVFERGTPMQFSRGSVIGLLYLSVLSTTVGMSLQNIGQSMAPASHASILLSLESVFGVIFSCIILGETVTGKMLLGFVMIFAAVLVSEMTPKQMDR